MYFARRFGTHHKSNEHNALVGYSSSKQYVKHVRLKLQLHFTTPLYIRRSRTVFGPTSRVQPRGRSPPSGRVAQLVHEKQLSQKPQWVLV